MNGAKAKILRNNSFGKGNSKRYDDYEKDKKTGQIRCTGVKALYKTLKKQYKRNRMNHI